MGLFFAGTRTVDCGGERGGVIAAIRFDALQEMVQDTPGGCAVYASMLEAAKPAGAAGRDQKKGA